MLKYNFSKLNQQSDDNLQRNRMTKEEKRINYYDLQAYKDQQPALFHMLPGWSPQVGVVKPFQKIDPRIEPSIPDLPKNEQGSPLKKINDMLKPTFVPNQEVTQLGSANKMKTSSGMIQNPYLQKEISKGKNLFSQAGVNTLKNN